MDLIGDFMMRIIIRTEKPDDYRAVEELAREAFWNLYFPGCHEHYVIHKMRDHKDFIKALSFVIEVDGNIAGGKFYTHSKIIADKNEYDTVTFGPVFISPQFHRKGLGKKLITHSIKEAEKSCYRAIITLGYPYHYEPNGFQGGKKYHISMPDGKYYQGLLVLPLYNGALEHISGYTKFSDVFDVSEEEVNKFDLTFPSKNKIFQKSQVEYETAVSMLDE